jgi:hypothetical protein
MSHSSVGMTDLYTLKYLAGDTIGRAHSTRQERCVPCSCGPAVPSFRLVKVELEVGPCESMQRRGGVARPYVQWSRKRWRKNPEKDWSSSYVYRVFDMHLNTSRQARWSHRVCMLSRLQGARSAFTMMHVSCVSRATALKLFMQSVQSAG